MCLVMLRNYQVEICSQVEGALAVHRGVMLQMPTGTGKTVVLAELVRRVLRVGRPDGVTVLIVTHRRELIEQTGGLLERLGLSYGVIAAGRWPKRLERVMVASVQTLTKGLDRLAPRLVIVDEAHHAVAKSYRGLWEAWPEARFLGMTATPCRLSGEGFTALFEVLVSSWPVKRFIAEGWLAPFDFYSIRPNSLQQRVIDSLRKRGADGDYLLNELREKLDVAPSIERLLASYLKLAGHRKGIVYAIDIAHAEHIATYYSAHGVEAVAVSSATPKGVREELVERFRCSEGIEVLVSVDLFSEGFDCPDVECIQLARPTLSLAKYLQMVGRGLRPLKGKRCCTMIDNVGLYRSFGLPSADRDWGRLFAGEVPAEAVAMGVGPGVDRGLCMGSLREVADEELVQVADHEGMVNRFAAVQGGGFERLTTKGVTQWRDLTSGVCFERYPQVVDFKGLELATADGALFFPRVASKWVDGTHGIHRKALETQVGDGIGWMRRYLSLSHPGRVLWLDEVTKDGVRVYRDEAGLLYGQQDLDEAPVCVTDEAGLRRFAAQCREVREAWLAQVDEVMSRFLEPVGGQDGCWRLPQRAVMLRDGEFYHVIYTENGERKEFWVEQASGFTYRHRPVVKRRGFVDLLFDGEMVFVRNVYQERYMPHRNWEIRADERLCVIGDKLYLKERRDEPAMRIVQRSGDFVMFVVQAPPSPNRKEGTPPERYIVINKPDRELEIRMM